MQVLIPAVNDVWRLVFYVARRVCFVCRGAMKGIEKGCGGGWMLAW